MLLHPGPAVLVVVAGVAAVAVYTVFAASYALFSVAITVVVSILLDSAGQLSSATLGQRVVNIAVGAATSLVVVRVWPTKVSQSIAQTLAAAVRAEGRFAAVLLHGVTGPAGAVSGIVGDVLPVPVEARAARLSAQHAVVQAGSEPCAGGVADAGRRTDCAD